MEISAVRIYSELTMYLTQILAREGNSQRLADATTGRTKRVPPKSRNSPHAPREPRSHPRLPPAPSARSAGAGRSSLAPSPQSPFGDFAQPHFSPSAAELPPPLCNAGTRGSARFRRGPAAEPPAPAGNGAHGAPPRRPPAEARPRPPRSRRLTYLHGLAQLQVEAHHAHAVQPGRETVPGQQRQAPARAIRLRRRRLRRRRLRRRVLAGLDGAARAPLPQRHGAAGRRAGSRLGPAAGSHVTPGAPPPRSPGDRSRLKWKSPSGHQRRGGGRRRGVQTITAGGGER